MSNMSAPQQLPPGDHLCAQELPRERDLLPGNCLLPHLTTSLCAQNAPLRRKVHTGPEVGLNPGPSDLSCSSLSSNSLLLAKGTALPTHVTLLISLPIPRAVPEFPLQELCLVLEEFPG